jgi:OTU domain-containing protein 3
LEFEEQVKKLGLSLKDVDGDGNCMFRSISDFLFGTEKKHFKLREVAVNEMRENNDFYGLFIEDD